MASWKFISFRHHPWTYKIRYTTRVRHEHQLASGNAGIRSIHGYIWKMLKIVLPFGSRKKNAIISMACDRECSTEEKYVNGVVHPQDCVFVLCFSTYRQGQTSSLCKTYPRETEQETESANGSPTFFQLCRLYCLEGMRLSPLTYKGDTFLSCSDGSPFYCGELPSVAPGWTTAAISVAEIPTFNE